MFPGSCQPSAGWLGDRQQAACESDTIPEEQGLAGRWGLPGSVRVFSIPQGTGQKSTILPEQLDFGKLTFSREVYPWKRERESVWVHFNQL